ncbi:MAG: hypothetical protein GF349_01520, partial [Candidatus Magasanikbacteria bacterium]|nr:hypothetical protein [Candidatus Magasanikbacteria bacterium]
MQNWYRDDNGKRRLKKIGKFILLPVFLVALISFAVKIYSDPAKAQITKYINYQAKLLDTDGVPVDDGDYDVRFRIYTSSSDCDNDTGSNLIWTESRTGGNQVSIQDGLFSLLLGEVSPFSDNLFSNYDGAEYYLGVKIGTDSQMTPCKRISGTMYAFNADRLDGLETSSTGSTTEYVPIANTSGNFTFTGSPQGTAISEGVLYINPATAATNNTLLAVAIGGSERFKIDAEGDVSIAGMLEVTGTSTMNKGVVLADASPDVVTNALYNSGGTLYWDGSPVGGGSSEWTFASNYNTNMLTPTSTMDVWLQGGAYVSSSLRVSGTTFLEDGLTVTGWITSTDIYVSGGIDLGGEYRTTWPSAGTSEWTFASNYNTNMLTPSSSMDVWLQGGAYVSSTMDVSGTSTFKNLVDIEGKVNDPRIVGRLEVTAGDESDVFVSGDYAYYVTSGDNTLRIVDITDPTSPSTTGYITEDTYLDGAWSVFVSGNYAYVANYDISSMSVVDVSDTADPRIVGTLADNENGAELNHVNEVFVQGNYAYLVAQSSNSFVVVDISDPTNPKHIKSLVDNTYLDGAFSLHVQGNYAYVVALDEDMLTVIDISDPTDPDIVGTIANGGDVLLDAPYSVFVQGKYAYVVTTVSDALEIIDISDPRNPKHAGSISNGGEVKLNVAMDVYVSGDYAYIVSQDSDSLEIVDVSDPTNPTHVSYIVDNTRLDRNYSIFVHGNYAYVTTGRPTSGNDGLTVIDVSGVKISNAEIGTAKIGSMQVMNHALFDNSINVKGGLMVGNSGLLLSGDFGMSAPTSTSVTTATNTLSFTHTALFNSRADASEDEVFIFDTDNTITAGDILSVRNNGTTLFTIGEDATVTSTDFVATGGITLGGVYRTTWPTDTTTTPEWTFGTNYNTNMLTPSSTMDVWMQGGAYVSSSLVVGGETTFNNFVDIQGKTTEPTQIATLSDG